MYFQITTRCNMSCGHCCYSCSFEGKDMSWETYKLAMDRWSSKINDIKQSISIGGGEPTIHPQFWKMLNYAMNFGKPWFATNGSLTEDVIRLAEMSKKGLIRACLSIDKFHNKIDPKVVNAFRKGLWRYPTWGSTKEQIENKTCSYEWYAAPGKYPDSRSIRVSRNPKKIGRCKEGVFSCCCPAMQIRPDGTVTACGCPDAPQVGTVKDGFFDKYKDKIPMLKKGLTHSEIFRCSKLWLNEGN